MSTLYEITGDMLQLLALAEDPEADGVNQDVFKDTFESLEMDFEEKADAYAKVLLELENRDFAISEEIERLTERRRVLRNSIQRMRDALMACMVATGKTKFSTNLFSYGIRKNPPYVVIDDSSKIPSDYLIPQEPKIDKTKIKEAFKDQDEAPFWVGIAHMERTSRLDIK